uniref:Uncharacterized protein n=1 Tax=Helianthus annuus TaxID=4232 RepID=A0A251T7P1_HELAN
MLSGPSKNRGNSSHFSRKSEYCRMHASESRLGSDIAKSYLASFAQEYSGCFSKLWHGWNRGTMKSRVLSGHSIF